MPLLKLHGDYKLIVDVAYLTGARCPCSMSDQNDQKGFKMILNKALFCLGDGRLLTNISGSEGMN